MNTGSSFWILFQHMNQDHNLILTDTELLDICLAVDRMRAQWKADELKRRCRECGGHGQIEIQSGPHYRSCDSCKGTGSV